MLQPHHAAAIPKDMPDTIHKRVLCVVHTCSITGEDPVQVMSKFLDGQDIQRRFDVLVRAGLLTDDCTITPKGRSAITVVLCGGVFDIIHHGHIHMINAAKGLGDMLVVVVASDNTARRKAAIYNDETTRRNLVHSIKGVDACVVGSNTGNIFDTVRAIRPDTIALGYDQVHRVEDIIDGCDSIGLHTKVVRLESPVPDITSSDLKNHTSMNTI